MVSGKRSKDLIIHKVTRTSGAVRLAYPIPLCKPSYVCHGACYVLCILLSSCIYMFLLNLPSVLTPHNHFLSLSIMQDAQHKHKASKIWSYRILQAAHDKATKGNGYNSKAVQTQSINTFHNHISFNPYLWPVLAILSRSDQFLWEKVKTSNELGIY